MFFYSICLTGFSFKPFNIICYIYTEKKKGSQTFKSDCMRSSYLRGDHVSISIHTWRLVTLWAQFLSWDDTCIIILWAHLSGLWLKAFWRCYTLAEKSVALNVVPSETRTWKITTVPKIHCCFVKSQNPARQDSFSWTKLRKHKFSHNLFLILLWN